MYLSPGLTALLLDAISTLKQRLSRNQKILTTVILIVVGVILWISAIGVLSSLKLDTQLSQFLGVVGLSAGAVLVGAALLFVLPFPEYPTTKLTNILANNLADAQKRSQDEPDKVKPAWDIAKATMELYFNRNLGQVQSIYRLSIVVMIAGFAIIIYGMTQTLQNPNNITPVIIGSLSGIITEFIGATFLFIYRSTVEQAANYLKTLEKINNVGMAMQILDGLAENKEQSAQEQIISAKIEVAKLLLSNQTDLTKK